MGRWGELPQGKEPIDVSFVLVHRLNVCTISSAVSAANGVQCCTCLAEHMSSNVCAACCCKRQGQKEELSVSRTLTQAVMGSTACLALQVFKRWDVPRVWGLVCQVSWVLECKILIN